jgi:diguanylate cyclase
MSKYLMKDHRSSLRRALLLPFVGLVVALALTLGALSYFTAMRGVDDFSEQLLSDISNRVLQATTQHLATPKIAISTVAPDAETFVPGATESIKQITPQSLAQIEDRLWLATGLFPEVSGYVYFGDDEGRFIGVYRSRAGTELRLKDPPYQQRNAYRSSGPGLRGDILRSDGFDPRTRVWYQTALSNKALTWSPIYIDATSRELTLTLARPMQLQDGMTRGVVATDLPLKNLDQFFDSLAVSATGVAFAVDVAGDLIAASSKDPLIAELDGKPVRLNAANSRNPLIRAAYAAMSDVTHHYPTSTNGVLRTSFKSDTGTVDMSATTISDAAGLNWKMVVAIPRADHMGSLRSTALKSIIAAVLAVLAAVALGLWLTQRISGAVTRLSDAMRLLASGHSPEGITLDRTDELGSIAQSVQQMSAGLLNDPLTGTLNRATFEKRFEARVNDLRGGSKPAFALAFIDLDKFKEVNDQYGHAMGDAVLAITSQRLTSQLRAGDVLARFGGDEFIVLLDAVADTASAELVIERMRKAIIEPILVAGRTILIEGSFGLSLFPSDGQTLADLTAAADQRMYYAKNSQSNS